MLGRKTLTTALALVLLAGTGFPGTAEHYRGPVDENPRGLFGPGMSGPFAVPRLVSRSRQVEGESRWEFWWEMNRERFLLRAAARNAAGPGDGPGAAFAMAAPEFDLVAPADVEKRIIPALLARLESADAEERAAAAIALGKARATKAFGALRSMLERGTRTDRRAAAIALGLLDEPLAIPALLKFLGRTGASPEDLSYAALGLGLIGAEEAAGPLHRALVESMRHRGREIEELQASLATALGLLEHAGSAPTLAKLATGKSGRSAEVRSAAAFALGRIDEPASVSVLAALLADSKVDVRRAAAQALARLGAPAAKSALFDAFEKDGDPNVRGLAAVALAEIGGRDVGKRLVAGLQRRNPRAVRGFSALALGILGDAEQAPHLRKLLGLKSETSLVSAAAVGLALVGDSVSMPVLWRIASDRSRPDALRGYAVVSLAMLGDTVTRGRLFTFARETGAEDLRRSATLAVGLYRDLPAGPLVLGSLFEERDPFVRGAAISALGSDARKSVLDSLLTVAGTPGFGRDARIDAVTALGSIAQLGRPSALSGLARNVNYRSMSSAVRDATHLL